MDNPKKSDWFMWAVIALGMACFFYALAGIDIALIDLYFLFLSIFTIAVGSRITIQIPRFKSHISVSDTFIFLFLILYGGEFAVVLAAIEATASAWRFCNRKVTVLFNAGTMAISTSAVVLVVYALRYIFDAPFVYGYADNLQTFVITLSLVALTQFFCNTALAAVQGSLRDNIPLWETWKSKYIWTFLSYFIGAAGAGIMVQLSRAWGLGIILAAIPVIFFVYLSYKMYLKNVEISIRQAEQAEEYANLMEEKSDALRESEERFRSAFNYAPIGIALVSSAGQWLKVNRALCDILGYSEDDFLAADFQSMIFPDDLGPTLVALHDLLSGKMPSCQLEHRYIHSTGKIVWASWSVSATSDAQSENPRLIFQIQDITDKKHAEGRLQHEATHDALTGLPNRPLFMARLAAALEQSKLVRNYKVSILFIDLDRFKYVNDSLGHLVGDLLLIGIAERLRECMRPSDLVARLGGDEFTILVEGSYDDDEVTRIAERIQAKFSIPFELDGNEVYSSASIGILHATDGHRTSEDMMRDADTAMYQAKRGGKARHEIFDEEMFTAAKETLRLETDLRRSIERSELYVEYQPIYALDSGLITGFEALARWRHSELGDISPCKFIPIAEEIGMIDKLCAFVLATACTEIGSLRDRGSKVDPFTLSVNLSCKQFAQSSLVPNIRKILDECDFAPHLLKFEITESVFVEHHDNAIEMLNQFQAMGIDISVDDFGTGYSNLSYLMKLPISTLKIDRSFVSMIDDSGENDQIVRAIITMAGSLGLKVVGEGVETEAQLRTLRELSCEFGQGCLLAAPMSFDDLCEFVKGEYSLAYPKQRFNDVSEVSVLQ